MTDPQAVNDCGFTGSIKSDHGATHILTLHLSFGLNSRLDGFGEDELGEFAISGTFTETNVAFSSKYRASSVCSRIFTGSRHPNTSISGRWRSDDGRHSGEFSVLHEESDKRFTPSYDVNRLKLYTVLEQLATGGFGIVSRIRRNTDGRVLVWKELSYGRMNAKERRMMITEVNILREIEHPHIVKYFDTIIVREQQKMFIVIEHCANGDMGALIDRYAQQEQHMTESFVWRALHQILMALFACHNREEIILHRDLKPANILLDDHYDVKVADFGLAAVVSTESLACSKVGTPLYMSPEQMAGTGYTAKSDMWSLGCIVYEMAALRPPFDAHNQIELAKCIQTGHFARIPSEYSEDLHRAICWMLQLQPENRPSADRLLLHLHQVRGMPLPTADDVRRPSATPDRGSAPQEAVAAAAAASLRTVAASSKESES
mmetsp:Transcript_26468/g.69570  ORF Transcript_26468/g.69570 Transcript_26468/m.69570 type:complete len:433 (-) Transcript_26468:459-1757(-)